MRVVVALGGNALLERREAPDADVQQEHVTRAVEALVPLAAAHQLVVTHGNGPQVGVLAAESARDRALSRPYPFDVVGAQTQGMIGYWLLQALENALPGRRVAAVLTQTVVAADDPAFDRPAKFVGPCCTRGQARRLEEHHGWRMGRDGSAWRRVVASPEPVAVVELAVVRQLLEGGAVVVCGGGGGIPVVRDDGGQLRGVEAVVDKDLTAALLAQRLEADALLVLTDVAAVQVGFGTAAARPIGRTTVGELRGHRFPLGSMGPKVDAVCRFVTATGGRAAIGRLQDAERLLAGAAGTVVEPGGAG